MTFLSAARPPHEVRDRLDRLLHRGLIDARQLCYAGEPERLAALIDTLHVVPQTAAHWGEATETETPEDFVYEVMTEFEAKFPDCAGRYTGILRPPAAPPAARAA